MCYMFSSTFTGCVGDRPHVLGQLVPKVAIII